MKELPQHEIEWIGRLRRQGCTWEYIADEWDMARVTLEKALHRAGVDLQSLGMPDLPTISRQEFSESPGDFDAPHMMKIRGAEPRVVMSLSEYLKLKGREEV